MGGCIGTMPEDAAVEKCMLELWRAGGFGLEGATFCNLFLNGAWSNSKRYT